MTENTHQRSILISGGVGGVFLPKRMLSEYSEGTLVCSSRSPLRSRDLGIRDTRHCLLRLHPGVIRGASSADWSRSRWKRTGCPRVLLTFAFDSPTFWHAGIDEIGADARKPKKIAKLTSRRGNRWR